MTTRATMPLPGIAGRLAIAALVILAPGALSGTAMADAPPPSGGQSAGEQLFRQRCQSCHAAAAAPAGIGPNLAGVVGRKAGSTGFAYSPALKASGLTWTKANLDTFLTAPGRLVPGTRMVVAIPDPAQRKAVIDFLARSR